MAWSQTSRHARGYGNAWEKMRLLVLKRDHYLCHCPRCKGGDIRVTPAQEVDHIKPKAQGGTDDMANLRAINRDCHKRVTTEQTGGQSRVRVGIDGWPVGE